MATRDTTELNETFDILTHPHRRYVLYLLTEESGTMSIDGLVTAITSWEANRTETGEQTDRNAIETALHHRHLPKLADTGIVAVGADTDSVTLRETDTLDKLLNDTAQIDGYPPIVAVD